MVEVQPTPRYVEETLERLRALAADETFRPENRTRMIGKTDLVLAEVGLPLLPREPPSGAQEIEELEIDGRLRSEKYPERAADLKGEVKGFRDLAPAMCDPKGLENNKRYYFIC